jgi:hypothetical protein
MPCNLTAYADKSDDALRYIITDATEALRCARENGDVTAEAKYSDQIADAHTTIARRGWAPIPRRRASRPAAGKDWQCRECGKRMTLKQAERAMSVGCSKCNGGDIDLA